MKKLLLSMTSLCLAVSLVVPAAAKEFADTKDHWAEKEIGQITELGIFNGVDENTFAPDRAMTRGMFVAVLGRTAQHMGVEVAAKAAAAFTDVSAELYYAPYVAWANENGIVNGVDAAHFAPDTQITRQQMCAIMVRFLKTLNVDLTAYSGTAPVFRDQDQIAAYAAEAVAVACGMGLIQGTEAADGVYFAPSTPATRAIVAVAEARLMDKLATTPENNGTAAVPGTDGSTGGSTGGGGGGGGTGGGETGPSDAEKKEEAQIASYLKSMLQNYKGPSEASEYLKTTPKEVQDCMKVLMDCIQDALGARQSGQFLTTDFVREEYAAEISDVKARYDAMTEEQKNQVSNVVVRLEETEHLQAVLNFFGVDYL